MIVTFITVIAGAAALGLLLKYKSAIIARFKGEVTVVASKGTAFARLAEQEGKVVALKAANAAKNAEAKAIHAGLDEFDKLIG
jgi:hypothetical protein